MTKNKLHSIFEKNGCLSIEQMQNYLDGKLPDKERYLFEKHINACSFCNDAFEGLQNMKNRKQLPLIIEDLNRKIDKQVQTNKTSTKILKPVLRIAALMLILIASVYFLNLYLNTTSPNMAFEEKLSQEQNMEEAPDMFLEKKPLSESSTSGNITKNDQQNRTENPPKYENKVSNGNQNTTNPAPSEEFIELDAEETTIEEEKTAELMEEIETKEENADVAIYEQDEISNEEIEELTVTRAKILSGDTPKSKKTSMLQSAINAYNQGEYKKSLELLNTLEKSANQKETLNYYKALNYHALDNDKKALKYFNQVISAKGDFYDDALWQKALILIKQDKTKQAGELLKQLIQNNSKYKNQAQVKLDSLEKS